MKPTREHAYEMSKKADQVMDLVQRICTDDTELMTVLASAYTMAIVKRTHGHPKQEEFFVMLGKGLEQGCRTLAGKGKKHDG